MTLAFVCSPIWAFAVVSEFSFSRPQARPTGENAIPPQPPSPARALDQSMAARGDWPLALARATHAGPLAIDLMHWHRLRAGDGQFEETLAFLERRADWPGLPLMRKNSEATIPGDALVSDVLTFFEAQAPRTLIGSLRQAQAFRALGQEDKAVAEARRGWTELAGSQIDEDQMLLHFAAQLAGQHVARLDAMLWQGEHAAALRRLPDVPSDVAGLAAARIGLQKDASNIEVLLQAVAPYLQNDAGLAFDRFIWRRGKGRLQDAIQLMLARSFRAVDLGRPDRWSNQRIRLARDQMWDKEWSRAYQLASSHHLEDGKDYAELEWISGYIALRQLNNPIRALSHFQRHGAAVTSPISLARTHYWQGQAHRALNDDAAAQGSFMQGAKYQTAFYGLLSAEEVQMPLAHELAGTETFDADDAHPITANSNYQIAQLLYDAGHPRLAIRFLTHLSETQDRDTIGVMTALAESRNRPNYELLLAKRAIQYGHVLHRAYFPLHPLAGLAKTVPPELALSIARRESEFFVDAASGVGAQGLMQLMPPTAQEMAGKLGLPYSREQLGDPDYNATLGIAYLAELQNEFGNSPVQIAAAYNAGPSRPKRWMRMMGDPRNGDIDVVDWIERVPFTETRNYIMRVTETMPAYRARLTGETGPVQFRALLNGVFVAPPPPLAPDNVVRPTLRPVLPAVLPEPVPATE
ncbi:MAG: lytic transglycosylase domain-containing protein [Pseudomonadota bacterium]